MKLPLRLSLCLLALAPLMALAQPKKVASVAQNAGQIDIYNAPDGTSTYVGEGQGVARITKNVIITQKGADLILYAQEAIYDQGRNQAKASGQLSVLSRDTTIRGQRLLADFNQRNCTIFGSVSITSHGKKDGSAAGYRKELTNKPIKVLCDRLVWDYDTHQATATGNIRIIQGDNRGTCNSIVYNETRNIIQLLGNVRFGDNKNRTLIGQDITIYVDQSTVSSNTKTHLSFPPLANTGQQTKKPPKATVPFAPVPTLPPNVLGEFAPPPPAPAPRPAPTEEPPPPAPPEQPAETEVPETTPAAPVGK